MRTTISEVRNDARKLTWSKIDVYIQSKGRVFLKTNVAYRGEGV